MADWREHEHDPRIQWAMKIMDPEGAELSTPWDKYSIPVLTTLGLGGFLPLRNVMFRKPAYTQAPVTAALALGGLAIGLWYRDWSGNRQREERAMMKHYIMTNPEKFLEPERKKFGEKEVLYAWDPVR